LERGTQKRPREALERLSSVMGRAFLPLSLSRITHRTNGT